MALENESERESAMDISGVGEWLPFIRFSSRVFERKNKTKDVDRERQGLDRTASLKINNIKAGAKRSGRKNTKQTQKTRITKKKEENESFVVEKSRGKRLKTNERCCRFRPKPQ